MTLLLFGSFCLAIQAVDARPRSVRVQGWLKLKGMQGQVVFRRTRPLEAWVGMKMDRPGDRLTTGPSSNAVFELDSGAGIVQVSENTTFSITRLQHSATGGRITHLYVSEGQVRLKLRSFNNIDSRLEIHTPAGITGVRGTEFGVSVQPNGKTGVATLSGLVDTTAVATTVSVGQSLQTLVIPQEAPEQPEPLQDDTGLSFQLARWEAGAIHVVGSIDKVNLLLVEGQPQTTDRNGGFDLRFPWENEAWYDKKSLSLTVTTPLGTSRRYELPIQF